MSSFKKSSKNEEACSAKYPNGSSSYSSESAFACWGEFTGDENDIETRHKANSTLMTTIADWQLLSGLLIIRNQYINQLRGSKWYCNYFRNSYLAKYIREVRKKCCWLPVCSEYQWRSLRWTPINEYSEWVRHDLNINSLCHISVKIFGSRFTFYEYPSYICKWNFLKLMSVDEILSLHLILFSSTLFSCFIPAGNRIRICFTNLLY